jgi:ribonuclease Z
VAGTEDVVKGFAEAYNSDAEFRIAQGHELVPTEAARMIGHDVARPGPEEAVTVYDKDGLKISAFLVNHDPVEPAYGYRIEYGGRAAVVSGDTARVENMVRFSKGADVLVHEALDRDMVEMLAKAPDASGNSRAGTMARQVIAYHTSPVDAAAIAKEASVPLLVFTHEVPPLRNGLMRRMFMRGVADAHGPGKTHSRQGRALDLAAEGLQGHPDKAAVLGTFLLGSSSCPALGSGFAGPSTSLYAGHPRLRKDRHSKRGWPGQARP